MSTRSVRTALIEAALAHAGRLTLPAYEAAVTEALKGTLTEGELGLLLRPGPALRGSTRIREAGLSLSVDPAVVARAEALAAEHGGLADLADLDGGAAPPAVAPPSGAVDLGDFTEWALSTSGADVRFSTEVFGRQYPALVMEKPAVDDPGRRDLAAEHRASLLAAATVEELAAVARAVVEAEASWFDAADLPGASVNRRFRVQNARRTAFLEGVRDLSVHRPGLGLPVNRALVELRDDLVSGRRYEMQVGEHTNYWPYDNGYADVVATLRDHAPAGSEERAVLTNRLFDIWRRKSAFKGRAGVDEKDAERTLGGVVVWRPPFGDDLGHRASLVEGSTVYAPRYERLTVDDGGESRRVWRDADGALRFDADHPAAAGEVVPPALAASVRAQPAPEGELSLRPPRPGEALRPDLPFDWLGGGISVTRIDIGWWGHCHNEAPANAMGMDPAKGVTLHRAHPGLPEGARRVDLSEEDCWDLVGALTADHEGDRVRDPATGRVSQPGYVAFSSGGAYTPTRVEETAFVGDRNNGGHWFQVTPEQGRRVRIDAKVLEIWGLEDPTHRYPDPMNRFRRDIEDEDGFFAPNPDWVASGLSDDDEIAVQAGGRRMRLETRFITFDGDGGRVERTRHVDLDPEADDFVALADEIEGLFEEGGGRVVEHAYNPKTRQLRQVRYAIRADADYARAELSREVSETVEVLSVQETTYDSVAAIDEFVVDDIGLPLTFDTSSGQAVWNYPVSYLHRDVLRRVTREEDGQTCTYTTFELSYRTMGGPSGEARYILKRDAMGRTVRALALDPMPDFAYRNERWVCAPVALDVRGRPALNLRGMTAGYLTDETGRRIVTDLWQRQALFLYASLSEATAPDRAWLVEEADGRVWSYPDEAAWQAAVDALSDGPAAIA